MKLAKIFSDNMVLQANEPIRVFGEGQGCVEIEFLGKSYQEIVRKEKWIICLDECAYGGPYEMKIRLNGEERILKNLMIGDVILCAGQSNVQFEVKAEKDFVSVCENTSVRCYTCDRPETGSTFQGDDGWQVGTKEKLLGFSALAFHLADFWNKRRGRAVGVVACCQGASVIRSWLNEESLTEDVFVPLNERHHDSVLPNYALWNQDGMLYGHSFLPITPFVFSSAVWYQGESDTSVAEGKVYGELLKRLIALWRKDLQKENLPFAIVEICDFDERRDEGWKAIQAAQGRAAEETENAFLITSSDVCEHGDIHPSDKRGLANKIVALLDEGGKK